MELYVNSRRKQVELEQVRFWPIYDSNSISILTESVGGILTKEGLTVLFDFLCGSGQGDSASATLFIFGIKILLIKLYLDPDLQKVIILFLMVQKHSVSMHMWMISPNVF